MRIQREDEDALILYNIHAFAELSLIEHDKEIIDSEI